VWALVYGAVAPLAMARSCNLEIGERRGQPRTRRHAAIAVPNENGMPS